MLAGFCGDVIAIVFAAAVVAVGVASPVVVVTGTVGVVIGCGGAIPTKVDGKGSRVEGICVIVVGTPVVVEVTVAGLFRVIVETTVPVVAIPTFVVVLGLSCAATGSDVKDGPTNVRPITPTARSELMNNNPENGLVNCGVPAKISVANREVCCSAPIVVVLRAMVLPRLLVRLRLTVATLLFGFTIAIPVSVAVLGSTLTNTSVSVTVGLDNTLAWKRFASTS
jgi:hypothetical protein